MQPIYDIEKSYQQNLDEGPFFDGPFPERRLPPEEEWFDFLGTPVASRIGVAAGPLLCAKWVELAARLGFDTLTYKTIRSHPHEPPFPNVLFIDEERLEGDTAYQRRDTPPQNELTITNSFGNPTKSDAFLSADIPRAIHSVGDGQTVVSSIVGTPQEEISMEADFCRAAARAVDFGAKIVEANFSCPNVKSADGCLYQSAEAFSTIGRSLVKTLGDIPLIIKMGAVTDKGQLRPILLAAARAGIRAVSGINTIKVRFLNDAGVSPLGPDRPYTGMCGNAVRETGLTFVRLCREIIDEEKLDLTLIGVGGILLPHHFDDFFNAGADFAQLATGMMWDPYLANKWRERCLAKNSMKSAPSNMALSH